MRLGRRMSEEQRAWLEVRFLWDAAVGELKEKVAEAQRAEDEGENDDERG